MYYSLYLIVSLLIIPGVILGIVAQIKVVSTFNKFSQVDTIGGTDAKSFARRMLDVAGYTDTKIQNIRGELTDNYNPTTDMVSLSDGVYNQKTVAALGVTAHEIGHVYQHKQGYGLIKLRNFLVPVVNISSKFMWPLLLVGLLMEIFYVSTASTILLYTAVGIYALSTIFTLVTLPVELNASKRAYKMLLATGTVTKEEAAQVKKVLSAAALTYVASLIVSILSFLRLFLVIAGSRRD